MASSWKFGGLSLIEILRRTVRESWKDEVFGQAGRMAFYHFLAIFPILFASLVLLMQAPHLRDSLERAIRDVSNQVLPGRLLNLLRSIAQEQNRQAHARFPVLVVSLGVLWASFNGTWAMIFGLNNAYETKENRRFVELAITIAGLSLSLAVTAAVSVFLIISTQYFQRMFNIGAVPLHLLEWVILIAALSFSFAILYRFGPNLQDRRWQWSTPGAVCALLLWIAATFGARAYFDHINDYSRSYGHLNGVVMLLLWLYITNGAILIGGEMNSEIEKAMKGKPEDQRGSTAPPQPIHASSEQNPPGR
ncbi:MAG TPA: YihY/virulence factor BrkB family protein [Acidobacteriaceae bacterium]|nr:YihY/virulence factor BrkB family protein [Acidobacteriaceae bacterium]